MTFSRDERAVVARRLHDGVAQTIAALGYQLAAAARECPDPATSERLATARALAAEALEQARALSHAVHPPPHGDPLRDLLAPHAP